MLKKSQMPQRRKKSAASVLAADLTARIYACAAGACAGFFCVSWISSMR